MNSFRMQHELFKNVVNKGPSTAQTPPNVAIPLCTAVEQKQPLRLVLGLSLIGCFVGSIRPWS